MISGQRILALAAVAVVVAALPAHAASDNELRAVRGTSGYQANGGAPFQRLFGHVALNDDAIAITRPASNALLVLPDSSEVALGANTNIRVGAFNDPSATTPTTITLQNGAVRFDVRHPTGGRANYVFQTVTSQIAVRGTIGLYSSGPNGDVVSCLACAPGDVVVTVGSQTYAIITGQTLTISLAGVVATVATNAVAAQAFAGTGLTTDPTAATAFTGSVGGAAGAAAAAAIPAGTLPIAGAVFAAGAAAAITSSNSSHPTAIAIPQTGMTSPVVPTPTPTPGVGTGNANLTGAVRKH